MLPVGVSVGVVACGDPPSTIDSAMSKQPRWGRTRHSLINETFAAFLLGPITRRLHLAAVAVAALDTF
jgi:hypothetical protein